MFNLKNLQLVPTIEFLNSVELKGKESRSRSKVVKKLIEKLKELQEDEKVLLESFSNKDESGEVVRLDDLSYDVPKENLLELTKQKNELLNEYAIVDCSEIYQHCKTLLSSLEDFDKNLSGQEAEVYDLLLDQLEEMNLDGK